MRAILKFSVFSFLLFGCIKEKVYSQGLNNISVRGQKSISMIFHLKEFSRERCEVELKDFVILPYCIKEFVSLKQVGPNGILVLLKNASGEIISQQNIASPLSEHIEIPSADGHIETTEIKKQEADFTIKLPYNITAQRVEVYRLNEHKNLVLIASFVLQ